MVDFGADVSTYPDLDPTFGWRSDSSRMLAEAVARRLETPTGRLPYDPEYGLDLRQFLNDDIGARERFVIAARVLAEIEKDERMRSAEVSVHQDVAAQTLTLDIAIQPLDAAEFRLTLGISSVGASVLSVQS
jgi:hypothetical protein